MGNVGSNSFHRRRRHGGESSSHDGRQQITTNQRVYAAAYTSQYPNLPPPHTPYYKHENGARYPPPPLPAVTSPESPDDHHRMAMDRALEAWVDGSYPPLHVDRQTVTITNNINIKKETFKIEPDEEHPGKFLVSFTFDATVPCSITLYFFAKEWKNGSLTAIKDESPPPLTLSFEKGLRQMFRQKPGTGVDLSMFDEAELSEGNETSVYPLALEAEGSVTNYAQITYAAFEKDITIKGEFEYKVRVVKQIFRVEGVRYDLQEIYGDDGKECVICLSEPQDTAVLPCCHMCMCNVCANVLRFQTSVQCPICRKPIERLLEIKVKSGV